MEMEYLNRFKVGPLASLFYIHDFITESEEAMLLNNIYEAPISKWKSLTNRRLQNWGGVVHEKGLLPQELPHWLTKITHKIYEESRLFPAPINHILINEYLPTQGIMPHQDGPAYFPAVAILSLGSPIVMDFTPHLKLTENLDNYSSDGASKIETDTRSNSHRGVSILLMPRSLLIFKDDAYSDYLHGIKDSEVQYFDEVNESKALYENAADQSLINSDEGIKEMQTQNSRVIRRTTNRVSLTCRLVLKVHKNLFKF